MSIKIIKPGILATLQDAGRNGYRFIGVGSGGAMDIFAFKVANYLAGNEESAAVMEINFPSPEILFEQNAIISLTGANFNATIKESSVPLWTTLFIKKNSLLKFKQPIAGSKMYMAVNGGWYAEKWLKSFSTHLKLGAGGHFGRPLKKDDIIEFRQNDFIINENKILPWYISHYQLDKIYQPENTIRCVMGVEWDLMDEQSKQKFVQKNFIISNQSDRMGYRLNSNPLFLQQPTELISSVVDTGIIQLLPDGNCIILMADHQTTGGYPRIASVIKADLPKLAQIKPGQSVNFTIVLLHEAEVELLSMQQILREIKSACQLNFKKHLQQ